ncbi:hypothetical protein FOMPIDRAFT_1051762 [Fomitopsis schrenkii]|uniref:DUF6535 domain-containing protein n=1 Tax=Fomitopsis schrenkii TaxID=2126942 RepID=S8F9E3_FOMSC|nr:hypothetical protein FOMPIDRAFT_1051762 [Fomitopsis schrenkii]
MAGIGSTSGTENQDKDLEKGDVVSLHEPAAKQGATNDSAAIHDAMNESSAKHDATNEPAAKQASTSEGAWKSMSDKVWEYEKDRIDDWNKQIDTLLVFVSSPSLVIQA